MTADVAFSGFQKNSGSIKTRRTIEIRLDKAEFLEAHRGADVSNKCSEGARRSGPAEHFADGDQWRAICRLVVGYRMRQNGRVRQSVRRFERASANDPNLHPCASHSPIGAGQREDTRNVGIFDAMQ
jgi:hypothetical protein